MEIRAAALDILCLSNPSDKVQATKALFEAAQDGTAQLHPATRLASRDEVPGRPAAPRLLSALQVPNRSPFTPEGRAALLHAIAHIEFNAINLALDAMWRFPDMPEAFYTDWLQVAAEEAFHFELLHEHLFASLGRRYGDFDAHDGLWTMAERTAGDVLARMALVPRTLEARGLDATPPLQAKLARAGDHRAVDILDIILRDEVGHVLIGNRWYRYCCQQQGLDPIVLYPALVKRYEAPKLRSPFNLKARAEAGFSAEEMAYLQSWAEA